MYAVIYVSREVIRFSDEDLENLLQVSRAWNSAWDITGLLLYQNGNFMQLLEGTESAVTDLLEKIKRDPRHRNVVVILQEETPQREFTDWSMAFRRLASVHVGSSPGHSDFLEGSLCDEKFVQSPSKSLKFLMAFKKNL